jgi:selenocysteine lyase/cysteine desulfurase
VLYGRRALLESSPARFLRTVPDRIPDRWESGTQSLEGQVGTTAAVEYLASVGRSSGAGPDATRTGAVHAGLRAMASYEEALSARLIAGLQALDGVTIRGITDPAAMSRRVPTVSITVDGVDPAELARFCDTRGIYLWSGHSYALPVVEWLGIADRGGVLRIGPTHYNSVDEIDAVVAAVGEYLSSR